MKTIFDAAFSMLILFEIASSKHVKLCEENSH
jgi:hypothetical protein